LKIVHRNGALQNITINFKGEVKLSLCFFNWAPWHRDIWKGKCSSTHSWSCRWVVSFIAPGHFTPRERAPSTHW